MRRLLILLLFAVTAVAGCGGASDPPALVDQQAFVGEWTAPLMNLTITPDGYLAYRRIGENGQAREITAPLKSFSTKKFSVGVGWFDTTFKVDVPPYRDGAVWRMTVDGVELVRPADGEPPPEA